MTMDEEQQAAVWTLLKYFKAKVCETLLRLLVEDLPNLRRQLLDAERLGQEIGAGIEHPVVHDGVARIAGRVEHLEIWPFHRARDRPVAAPTCPA